MSISKVPLEQLAYTNIDRQRVLRTLKSGVHENEFLRRDSLTSDRIFNDPQHQPRSGSRSNVPVLPSLRSGSSVQNNKRRPSDAMRLLPNSNLPSTLHYRGSEGAPVHSPHLASLYVHRTQATPAAVNLGDSPSVNPLSMAGQSTPRTAGRSSLRRVSDGCPTGASNSPRVQDLQRTPVQQPLTPINFTLPGPRYNRSRATSGSSSGSSTYIRKYKYNPPTAGDQGISPGSSDSASMTAATTTRASPLTSLVSTAVADSSPELKEARSTCFGSALKEKEQIKRSSTTMTKRCAYGKPLVTIDDICEMDRMFHDASCTTQTIPPVGKELPDAASIQGKLLSTAESHSSIDQVKALRLDLIDSSDNSDDNDPVPTLTGNTRSRSCITAGRQSEYLTIFLGARKG